MDIMTTNIFSNMPKSFVLSRYISNLALSVGELGKERVAAAEELHVPYLQQ